MEIQVTEPIQKFIERQIARGYSDPSEVARQAFLRWMEQEEFESDPPALREKIQAARQGAFRPYQAGRYQEMARTFR